MNSNPGTVRIRFKINLIVAGSHRSDFVRRDKVIIHGTGGVWDLVDVTIQSETVGGGITLFLILSRFLTPGIGPVIVVFKRKREVYFIFIFSGWVNEQREKKGDKVEGRDKKET